MRAMDRPVPSCFSERRDPWGARDWRNRARARRSFGCSGIQSSPFTYGAPHFSKVVKEGGVRSQGGRVVKRSVARLRRRGWRGHSHRNLACRRRTANRGTKLFDRRVEILELQLEPIQLV